MSDFWQMIETVAEQQIIKEAFSAISNSSSQKIRLALRLILQNRRSDKAIGISINSTDSGVADLNNNVAAAIGIEGPEAAEKTAELVKNISIAFDRMPNPFDEESFLDRSGQQFIPDMHVINGIQSYVAHADRTLDGTIKIAAFLKDWPKLKRGQNPWRKEDFSLIPFPTGDADEDEEVLIQNGYRPPKFFNPNHNETVGLFLGLNNTTNTVEYYPIKYRTKLALQSAGVRHATISGGTLCTDRTGKLMFVHQRSSQNVFEAPDRYHTFCGSVRVETDQHGNDRETLKQGCIRETLEETGCAPDLSAGRLVVFKWAQLKGHGNVARVHEGIDFVCLGARLHDTADLKTKERWDHRDHWEGFVKELLITEEALQSELIHKQEQWFASGLAHILVWLSLGAPGSTELRKNDCDRILGNVLKSMP